jgi:N-acetylmuramoyl-L-alanine amidase
MDRLYEFRGSFFTLHVVPRGAAAPTGSTPASRWDLRMLPLDQGLNTREATRLLRDVGLGGPGLGGAAGRALPGDNHLFDLVPSLFDLHKTLRQPFVVPFDEPDEDVLGPEPEKEETHWIGVQLLDDKTGDPLPGRPYAIGGDDFDLDSQSGKLGDDGTAREDNLLDHGDHLIRCPNYPPVADQDHVVVQGEHASGIAETFGYEKVDDVWGDPSNADIAKLRKPHILFPGDVVHIPARPAAVGEKRPADQYNVFRIPRSPLHVDVELHDNFKHALAGVDVSFQTTTKPTGKDGLVSFDVGKQERGGKLALPSRDLNLSIGHLDPIEEDTGWRARLVNLGFMWDDDGGPDEDHIALEDFQADQGLPITGELDDATRAKIAKAHGC